MRGAFARATFIPVITGNEKIAHALKTGRRFNQKCSKCYNFFMTVKRDGLQLEWQRHSWLYRG
jgi:hypothetical protein